MSASVRSKSASVKVGARTYGIALIDTDAFSHELSIRGVVNDSVKSFIDYDDQLIIVNDALKEDHKRELIVHELLHACLEDSGTDMNEEHAEKIISLLAPRLNQLLNGQLLKTLNRLT